MVRSIRSRYPVPTPSGQHDGGGRRTRMLALAIALASTCVLLIGCDDPFIDPFRQGAFYTVWGYISTFEDTHHVRVVPVRRSPEQIGRPSDPHGEIDAQVFSEDLQTGRRIIWQHDLRRLDDGSFGHIFTAVFTVREGARYRLRVVRSDGVFSTAETTVPEGFEAEIDPARLEDGELLQTIRWNDVPTPENMVVVYCAGPIDSRICADGADGGGFLVQYGQQGVRVGNDWEVTVNLSRDMAAMRDAGGLPSDMMLGLFSLQMRLIALDEGWRVLDDPNAFAQPTELDNVLGGFGYWGAIGNSVLDWFPEEEALAEIRVVPQPFEGGKWQVASSKWQVASSKWQVASCK